MLYLAAAPFRSITVSLFQLACIDFLVWDRVVALPSNPRDLSSVDAAIEDLYVKLVKQEPITCPKSGIEHAAIPSPDAVILDVSIFVSLILIICD